MTLCSLLANRGRTFDQFLGLLRQNNINDLTLRFRGSVRKPHTYRVRNLAYADGRKYVHQLRSATVRTDGVSLLDAPALREIIERYARDVAHARQKEFVVTPRVDVLAAYDLQYLTMGMSEDFPKIREIIEKRVS
jgi:hypothetical protein